MITVKKFEYDYIGLNCKAVVVKVKLDRIAKVPIVVTVIMMTLISFLVSR